MDKAVALSALAAALFAAPAFADEMADVTKLVRGGQYAEALGKADAFLAKNPRDAQMRFLKGVILTEQNKPAEAITIFTRLTEDFPALPEPYNNLAVLYAASGQYDKARAALDSAIRTNPTYATAYENLGDVHAKLASQAYDKALQLDSGNSAAKSKLTLVRTLVGNTTGGTNPKVASTAPASQTAAAPVTKPAQEPASKTAAASARPAQSAAANQVALAPTAPAAKTPAAKSEPAKQEAKPAANNGELDDVMAVVNGWAKAWSSQDVKGYLNFYGSDFQVPGGQARKTWEEERRSRIAGKGRISVKVEQARATVQGNTATVKFRQVYVSDQLTANTRKILVLAKQGGKWQIKQEQTGR
ncbi:L,D-transpeptidase Cds6 family protein [Noviherbaspirillum cavernae]|uniref:nuclear transport factor 2 family protein n=1 Tax=Noviherbaspirillum cavernae TaxID=2320862 RepID=UPI0030F38F7E